MTEQCYPGRKRPPVMKVEDAKCAPPSRKLELVKKQLGSNGMSSNR